jgi:hypothetical protein
MSIEEKIKELNPRDLAEEEIFREMLLMGIDPKEGFPTYMREYYRGINGPPSLENIFLLSNSVIDSDD